MDFKVTYLDGGLGAITVNRTSNGMLQGTCGFGGESNKVNDKTRSKSDRANTNRANSRNANNGAGNPKSNNGNNADTANISTVSNQAKCQESKSRQANYSMEVVAVPSDSRRSKYKSTKQKSSAPASPVSKKLKTNSSSIGSFESPIYSTPELDNNSAFNSSTNSEGSFMFQSHNVEMSRPGASSLRSHSNTSPEIGGKASLADTPSATTNTNSMIQSYNSSWSAPVNSYMMEDGVHLADNMFAHQTPYQGHAIPMGGAGNTAAAAAAAAAAVAYSAYHSNYQQSTGANTQTYGQHSHHTSPHSHGPSTSTYVSLSSPVEVSGDGNQDSTSSSVSPGTNFIAATPIRPNPFFSAENLLHYSSRHSLGTVNNNYSNHTPGNDIYAVAAAIHHGQRNQYLPAPGGSSHYHGHSYSPPSYQVQPSAASFSHYSTPLNESTDDNYIRGNVPSLMASEFGSFDPSSTYRFGSAYHAHHQNTLNDPYAPNYHGAHSLKPSSLSLTNGSDSSTLAPVYGSSHLASISATSLAANELNSSSFFNCSTNGANRLALSSTISSGQHNNAINDSSLTPLSANFNVHPLWNGLGMLTANRSFKESDSVNDNSTFGSQTTLKSQSCSDNSDGGKSERYYKKRKLKQVSNINQLSISLPNVSSNSLINNPMNDTPPASSSSSGSVTIVDELNSRKHDSPDSNNTEHKQWNSLITTVPNTAIIGNNRNTSILSVVANSSQAKMQHYTGQITQQVISNSHRTSECFLSPSSTSSSSSSIVAKVESLERITPNGTPMISVTEGANTVNIDIENSSSDTSPIKATNVGTHTSSISI